MVWIELNRESEMKFAAAIVFKIFFLESEVLIGESELLIKFKAAPQFRHFSWSFPVWVVLVVAPSEVFW